MLLLPSCIFVKFLLSVYILPVSPPLRVFLYEVHPHKTTSFIQQFRPRAYTSNSRSQRPCVKMQGIIFVHRFLIQDRARLYVKIWIMARLIHRNLNKHDSFFFENHICRILKYVTQNIFLCAGRFLHYC